MTKNFNQLLNDFSPERLQKINEQVAYEIANTNHEVAKRLISDLQQLIENLANEEANEQVVRQLNTALECLQSAFKLIN
jgi:plasmid stabilization system protein ParE